MINFKSYFYIITIILNVDLSYAVITQGVAKRLHRIKKVENNKNLEKATEVIAKGLHAESLRTLIIAQNIANSRSMSRNPGGKPYTRQILVLSTKKDRQKNIQKVQIVNVSKDTKTPYSKEYSPNHPAADKDGFIIAPNVNVVMENADFTIAKQNYATMLRVNKHLTTMRQMNLRSLDK